MRIFLPNNTPSAPAVLRPLFKYSPSSLLHRNSVQLPALELKTSSLRALAAASMSDLGAKEAIQHVAAGMLLCSFEVNAQFTAASHDLLSLMSH